MEKVLEGTPLFAKELVAGGVAGGLAKTLVAPLDRVKILFQVTSGSTNYPSILSHFIPFTFCTTIFPLQHTIYHIYIIIPCRPEELSFRAQASMDQQKGLLPRRAFWDSTGELNVNVNVNH